MNRCKDPTKQPVFHGGKSFFSFRSDVQTEKGSPCKPIGNQHC